MQVATHLQHQQTTTSIPAIVESTVVLDMLDKVVSTNKMIKSVQGFPDVVVIPITIRMQGDKNMQHYFLTAPYK
jgi:hypothetical protein